MGALSGGRWEGQRKMLGVLFFVPGVRFWNLCANGNDLIQGEIPMKILGTKDLKTRGDKEHRIWIIVNKSVTKNLF